MSDQSTNQANYENQQNFRIDVAKVYTDIIKKIDDIRSLVNISNADNHKILNSLTEDSLTAIRQGLKSEQTYQESRCHAFFRLIGFPVKGTDNFYNPGLDTVKMSNKKIDDEFKIQVTKSLISGFRELSNFRETYLANIAKIFSANESIDASVLALSSINIRKFAAASEKITANLQASDQSYDVDLTLGLVGNSPGFIPFSQYIDASGTKPTLVSSKRYHIIIPFMVDPWIDFSVSPNTSLVGVPFVTSKANLIVKAGSPPVKRPLIEKVVRDRYNDAANQPNGDWADSLKQFVQDIPSIKDVELINTITNNSQQVEQQVFYNFLNIMMEMMVRLNEAHRKITEVQLKYYWLPIPATTGVEGGVSVRPIMSQISKEVADAKLITPADSELVSANIKNVLNQSGAQMTDIDGTPDKGDFAFDVMETFTPETTEAYGDNNAEVLTQLTKKRESDMDEAGKALRDVEIIMGEFSGLGLCDIVAILGALYVMPKDLVLGFLDEDAFFRAKAIIGEIQVDKPPELSDALDSLTKTVKDFYNLMDKLYLDHVDNNNLP